MLHVELLISLMVLSSTDIPSAMCPAISIGYETVGRLSPYPSPHSETAMTRGCGGGWRTACQSESVRGPPPKFPSAWILMGPHPLTRNPRSHPPPDRHVTNRQGRSRNFENSVLGVVWSVRLGNEDARVLWLASGWIFVLSLSARAKRKSLLAFCQSPSRNSALAAGVNHFRATFFVSWRGEVSARAERSGLRRLCSHCFPLGAGYFDPQF